LERIVGLGILAIIFFYAGWVFGRLKASGEVMRVRDFDDRHLKEMIEIYYKRGLEEGRKLAEEEEDYDEEVDEEWQSLRAADY
jgi:hypothetical protein